MNPAFRKTSASQSVMNANWKARKKSVLKVKKGIWESMVLCGVLKRFALTFLFLPGGVFTSTAANNSNKALVF